MTGDTRELSDGFRISTFYYILLQNESYIHHKVFIESFILYS